MSQPAKAQQPRPLGKAQKKSMEEMQRLRRWTAKKPVVQSTNQNGRGKYNIQQCRTVLIEHVERCRKCSMSHSEMLRAKNDVVIEQHIAGPCLDQNALQMRHRCYTSNTSNMSRVFHSWHRLDSSGTSESTRFTTPVSPSEKAGNCRPGKTCRWR